MTRTQIPLPDEVYQRAKRLTEQREISLAELVRRGNESRTQCPGAAGFLSSRRRHRPEANALPS
jgi:hypothetical protein